MSTDSIRSRGLLAGMLATFITINTPADVLELEVVDAAGHRLPCRILVRPDGGECITPEAAAELRIGPDRWFMSTGHIKLEVPAGRVLVRVERGLEFARFKRHLDVSGTRSERVALRRWIDMRRRGYLTGENHLHVDSVPLASMLVAEGLDFGTSLTWWNGPSRDVRVPAGIGRTRDLGFAGITVPGSVHDAELEYSWGAAYLQNLPAPLPLKSEPGRPNLDYLRHVVESGGVVHYQGGWSREVAVDALLGYVHTVNVCNNNFHLHRFQPRGRYSNLLEVEGFPIYPDTDVGMMRMNTDTYYRLLNWGLRLAAGAGSATGVKEVPPGYNRTYVRVRPGASIDQFNKAWVAGRNFVTNGPMLFLGTKDGSRPGDAIDLPAGGGAVQVEVETRSDQVLTAVEVIVNGEVAKSFEVPEEKDFSGTATLRIDRGSWIAARCTVRDELLSDEELAVYANGERQRPSRLRFAHTSPIYITVGGKRAAVRKSIEEGLRLLGNFESFASRTASDQYRAGIVASTREARRRLEARLADAEADWPQWRGPARDGKVTGDAWPESLQGNQLKQLWRIELGPSFSGPIVSKGRVFVTETTDAKHEAVRALQADTGKEIWKTEWEGAMKVAEVGASMGSWIRATPTCDSGDLFVAGMPDVLVCLDAETGAERWRADFHERYGTPLPELGLVSSPLVVGDGVYVQAADSLVRVDRKTGKSVWRTLVRKDVGQGAYSSPDHAVIQGRSQLLVADIDDIAGVDPPTGKILWKRRLDSYDQGCILAPVAYRGGIFTSTRASRTGFYPLTHKQGQFTLGDGWKNKLVVYMSHPVVIGDHAYVHLKNGRMACVDLKTGKETWISERRFGKYLSMICREDRILALTNEGQLLLIHARPDRFELVDSRSISTAETWGHVAMAGKRIYVRERDAIAAYRWGRE